MKNSKKGIAALLIMVMTFVLAACGNSKGSSGNSDEDVEYAIIGNYVYQNADGGNTDEDGVAWYLYIDAETKFHLVGVKNYENAAPSIRIDEGQVVSVNGYSLDCAFVPYQMFTQYLHHGSADEEITSTVKSITQETISEYIDKTGDEFFTIQLNRTSNDVLNSGTFSVSGEGISLGWGSWQ